MSLDNLYYPVEARIARVLVRALVRAGFRISVDNGEDTHSVLDDNPDRIEAAMAHTDEEHLIVFHPETKLKGWIFLVYGNGEDLINDYTTNLEDDAPSAPVLRMILNEVDAAADGIFTARTHRVEDALWIAKLDAEREKSS